MIVTISDMVIQCLTGGIIHAVVRSDGSLK